MKIITIRFYVALVCLMGITSAFAKPNPPAPNFKKPPPPPGLPIDDNIYMLLLIAFLFGIFIIYKNNIKTKTPS